MWKQTVVICLVGLGLACSKNTVALQNPATSPASELKFSTPPGWIEEKPTSRMRVAQYKLPHVSGDSEDASVVLYYFGQDQGGDTAANIERWVNQMQQPDGTSSKGKAREEILTVNGLKVTTVDVSGTYTAEMSPGSGSFHNSVNYRLRAAVVETPKGSYFVKLVGPERTIAKWEQEFSGYIRSFEFK